VFTLRPFPCERAPPRARALLPATRSRSSGPLGVLLSPPALDVKLLTALHVLQDTPVPPCVGRKCTTTENLCVWWRHAIHSPIPPPLAPEGTLGVTWSATVGNLTSHHRPAAERGRQVRAVCCISFFTTKILCYYFLFGHFVRTCWGVCSLWCAHVHYGTRSLNKSHSELCAVIMTALQVLQVLQLSCTWRADRWSLGDGVQLATSGSAGS